MISSKDYPQYLAELRALKKPESQPKKPDSEPVGTIMDRVLERAVQLFDKAVLSSPGPVVYDKRLGTRVDR